MDITDILQTALEDFACRIDYGLDDPNERPLYDWKWADDCKSVTLNLTNGEKYKLTVEQIT